MKAPEHLTIEAKRLFRAVMEEYDLTPAEVKILQTTMEALDRATAARQRIDAEGLTLPDRFGQPKPHPLLTTERDARSQFLTGMRQLNLEGGSDEPARAPGRPSDFERLTKQLKGAKR